MPTKSTKKPKKPKPEHRPLPEDPHELAQAMFRHGDKRMKEKRETENRVAEDATEYQPVTPRQSTG